MRCLVGVFLVLLVASPDSQAARISKPPTITKWDESTASQLNIWLESVWQLTNGRYTVDVTTTNPNGSRAGTNGDLVFFNLSGSYKLCVNTTATTAVSTTGTTWRCTANAFTAP